MSSLYQDHEGQNRWRREEREEAYRERRYNAPERRDHGHSFPDHPLHGAIAEALGWTTDDVRSFSLPALRELVRPVSVELATDITLSIHDMCST